MIDLLALKKDIKKRLKDELEYTMYKYCYDSVDAPYDLDLLYDFKYKLDDDIDEIVENAITKMEVEILRVPKVYE